MSWTHVQAPEELPALVFSERARVELLQRMKRTPAVASLRPVPLSGLAATGPLEADGPALLDRLRAHAPPARLPIVEFLARATFVAADPLVPVWAWSARGPAGAALSFAIVYDDRFLPGEALSVAFERLTGSPAPG